MSDTPSSGDGSGQANRRAKFSGFADCRAKRVCDNFFFCLTENPHCNYAYTYGERTFCLSPEREEIEARTVKGEKPLMNARSKAKAVNLMVKRPAGKYVVREVGSRVSRFEGNHLDDAQRERDKMRDAGIIMATIFELRGGAWKEVSPEDSTEALTRKLQLQIRQIDSLVKKTNALCRE